MLAWHFIDENTRCGRGDAAAVVEGKLEYVVTQPMPGTAGFQAGRLLLDALKQAEGSRVCRLRLSREVVAGPGGVLAAEAREVLWTLDATEALVRFTRHCGKETLALREPFVLTSPSIEEAARRAVLKDSLLPHADALKALNAFLTATAERAKRGRAPKLVEAEAYRVLNRVLTGFVMEQYKKTQ